MEPLETHEEYPPYARSNTKPVTRARHIIDNGVKVNEPCTFCIDAQIDCYRWDPLYSKCAYCTSKDKTREECHLPGEVMPAAPEKRRKRKIIRNVYAPDAASTADTLMSGTLLSSTPLSAMRSFAPIPDPSTTIHGVQRGPALLPLQLGADATLERGTALENQVAVLEQGFMELQVKFEELLSCVRAESQPGREEVADASSVGTAHEGEEATAVEVDWEKTPEHTIAHSSSFRPINCICALPFTLKDDLIMAREVEMLDGI